MQDFALRQPTGIAFQADLDDTDCESLDTDLPRLRPIPFNELESRLEECESTETMDERSSVDAFVGVVGLV